MNMKRIALSLALVGLLCQLLHAQSGHYFLSHYKPGMDKISYLSFDIHQDKNGILYFANRSGLLQFDGRTWTQVPANGAVYTLTAGPQGDLYAGGYAGFGKVGHNERNQLTYSSLSDSLPGVKNVIASTTLQNTIYFVSEKSLYKVIDSTAVASLVTSAGRSEGSYVGLYTVGDQVFVDTELEGVKKLIGGKLEPAEYFKGKHFVFSEQAPDQKTTLVATEDNKFYIQREGASPVQFFPADFQYLLANVVVNAHGSMIGWWPSGPFAAALYLLTWKHGRRQRSSIISPDSLTTKFFHFTRTTIRAFGLLTNMVFPGPRPFSRSGLLTTTPVCLATCSVFSRLMKMCTLAPQ